MCEWHLLSLKLNEIFKEKNLLKNEAFDSQDTISYVIVQIFQGTFSEKSGFSLLALPKQKSFLTISNENIFSKTQGARFGAKVAPNKGLDRP